MWIFIKKVGEIDCVEDIINIKIILKEFIFYFENKKYNVIEVIVIDVVCICVVWYGVLFVKVIVVKFNVLCFCESLFVIIECCWEDFDWNEVYILMGLNIEFEKNLLLVISLL